MVVAEEVAEAVRCEMDELGVEAALRLAAGGVDGDHDVAEQAGIGRRGLALRERQHVGRPVLAAPVAVEDVDRRVVGEPQRDVEIAAALGQRGGLDHARDLAAHARTQRGGHRDAVVDRQVERHRSSPSVRGGS